MAKLREIVLGPAVMLPPLDTTTGERPMSQLEFLEQFVLTSDGLKTNDNLTKLFEMEEAIEKVKAQAIEKSGSKLPANVQFPPDPGPSATKEQRDKYQAEVIAMAESVQKLNAEHWRAVYTASEGLSFTVSDEAFQAACTAVKSKLDEMARPNPMTGRPAVDPFVERKVLRLYHAFVTSKEV